MKILCWTAMTELAGWRAVIASVAGAVFTAVCAQIGFHLPGNPIPVTLQVFAVVLCAMTFGGKLAAISQIQYLAAGALGAPVFAGFKGGLGTLAGPTGGYLVGFVIAAYVTGELAQRVLGAHNSTGESSKARLFTGLCAAGLTGVVVIYLFGRAWFAVWLGNMSGLTSWMLGVVPFVVIDALKVVAAAAICARRS